MTTATATRSTRRSATKATPARRTRSVRGNTDARDAILREAEHARQSPIRSEQAQHGVKMVDAGELKHLVADMPDKYLACRSFGHGKALANYTEGRGFKSFTLYCPSCKFRRDIVMNSRTGEIIEDKPDWPEGYLLPKGSGRIGANTKGVVRIATIDRVLKGTTKKVRGL